MKRFLHFVTRLPFVVILGGVTVSVTAILSQYPGSISFDWKLDSGSFRINGSPTTDVHPLSKVTDEAEPHEALKPEQLIRNPAGWRGWVDKPLGGDRYQITFENGLTDEYPRHLLRVQEG